MCLVTKEKEKEREVKTNKQTKKQQREILKIDTTFRRNSYQSQQETDVSNHMCYLKFTFNPI